MERKDVELASEQSVQPRATREPLTGAIGLLNYLSSGNYRIAPYWSPQRDEDLQKFWRESDHLSGAMSLLKAKVATVPVKVLPRDNSVQKHQEDAEEFTILLNEESDFGAGYVHTISKWLEDWWACDNGAFLEILGEGKPDGPIKGQALGIAHLDSHRCQRTGGTEFPVIYNAPDGHNYKLHSSRVAFAADSPSAREDMYGVGFCAVSRAINNAQMLIDIGRYKQEKIGSRPLRGILMARGIKTATVKEALEIAAETMDARGFTLFSQLALLGDIPVEAALDLIDLTSLPDGYDEDTSTRLGMFMVALAFGVPIRWLWPASVSGATKADAMYQHIAGLGGGVGLVLQNLTLLLGGGTTGKRHSMGKFLPPHLKMVFDFQDDEQDRNQAEIRNTRAQANQAQLDAGLIDVRTGREQMLEAGDLTQNQFERLELADGRLPGGEPVVMLFQNTKEPFLSWLDLGVENPLAVSSNDPVDMLSEINIAAITIQDQLANTTRPRTRQQGWQALAALDTLKAMYAPLAQQSIRNSVLEAGGTLLGSRDTASPQDEPEQGPEDIAQETQRAEAGVEEEKVYHTKQLEHAVNSVYGEKFNFGVGGGEVIGGQLARDPGGRFINTADLLASTRAAMMNRLRNVGKLALSSADAKKAANRALVAEKLGISVEQLEALAGMRSGETSREAEAELAKLGWAQVNPDGSITMTKHGRALLKAANSGNVDGAEQAKADAASAEAEDKKPKGRAGPKPKPSGDETARQLGDRLPIEQYQALRQFEDGAAIPTEMEAPLAQAGLIEIDPDGVATLTPNGRKLLRAARSGDLRAASDALSDARQDVKTKQRRVEEMRRKAEEYRENATEGEDKAKRRAADLVMDAQNAIERGKERATSLVARAEDYEKSIEEYEAREKVHEERADEIDNEIRDITNLLRNTTDPEQRKYMQEQINALEKQSASERAAAKTQHQNRLEAEQRFEELKGNIEDVIFDANERAAEYISRAEELLKGVSDAAEEWERRAKEYERRADELERSIAGGIQEPPSDSLLGKAWRAVQKAIFKEEKREVVIPRGNPLPPLQGDTVFTSDEEIAEAIRQWDADMEDAVGLLQPSQASLVEVAEQMARGNFEN